MPGKARHGLKRPLPVQKRKTFPTAVAPVEPATKPREAEAEAAPARAPVPAPAAVARYPYLASELRMVGIVSAIVLVIPVVLAFVLS